MGKKKSPQFIIFTTVLVDLIGFGMVIPLVGLYGKHFGATGLALPVLGGIYSLMQFFFAPFWGGLSDRIGRRPVILISLLGSTLSYVIFGLASSFWWLIVARAFGGIFAANISTAQAYVADVTRPEERARGMGMIGAAFGIGFMLGPPLGGIASAKIGLWAPGIIASAICGINFLVAIFRLPETLTPEHRSQARRRSFSPLNLDRIKESVGHPELWYFFLAFFLVTFAFSNMEQTFSLLFQNKFGFETGEAGYRTGLVLMVSGILGAFIQGGLIRKLAPMYGERKLLVTGLLINFVTFLVFPYGPNYASYFAIAGFLSLGSSLVNPSISALTSRAAGAQEQGVVLGISQGLGSLARALGPFCGLLTFTVDPAIPYWVASSISVALLIMGHRIFQTQVAATA